MVCTLKEGDFGVGRTDQSKKERDERDSYEMYCFIIRALLGANDMK